MLYNVSGILVMEWIVPLEERVLQTIAIDVITHAKYVISDFDFNGFKIFQSKYPID